MDPYNLLIDGVTLTIPIPDAVGSGIGNNASGQKEQ